MSGEGFIPGIWCGIIFGAAFMLLAVSLCFAAGEADKIADEERLAAMRREGL